MELVFPDVAVEAFDFSAEWLITAMNSLLSSIDDRTVDLYKKKGTPEQDSLYQAFCLYH